MEKKFEREMETKVRFWGLGSFATLSMCIWV